MASCGIQPEDKRRFISDVGRQLEAKHGKQKFYKPSQVQSAVKAAQYPLDWACWAHCFFDTAADFALFHESTGEECDYAAMKSEVVSDLAGETSAEWFSVDLSWLEWPDVDFSSVFDWFVD